MTEKELEKKLSQAVKSAGGVCYKFSSPGHAGVPDRLIVLPSICGFVEVKKPGKGKLSKIQEIELARLSSLKMKCYILDDPAKVDLIIEDLQTGLKAEIRYRES